MSWLYSQALVAAFLPASCSDGELSVQSSGNPTQLAYLPPDKMTDFSRLSRFGMTFRPLTDDRGEELLTLYRAAFPAKTLASQEKARALQASDRECGDTWRGSLARFDPVTSLWKTVQRSLLEDSESSSVTWPRSGMTADGQCWELPTLERRTRGTDSGLWVPTPCAMDATPITGGNLYVTETGTVRHMRLDGKSSNRGLAASAAMWPTPTVCGNYNRKGASATRKDGKSRSDMLDWAVEYQTGGRLNPTWVEWLMAWPLGWTDLKPLETDRFHSAPLPPGTF